MPTNQNNLWPAPAKINLMLRIVGQREDGYHLLQTVFQFVDLCDWLSFDVNCNSKVQLLNATPGVNPDQDLTVRAAKLLQQATGCSAGVAISLQKNIPMGAGLGGGSSDAATTLLALNHLWQLNLSKNTVLQLAVQLGADVPIFVFGYAAWAQGIGEELTKIDPDENSLLIIKPDCAVDTGAIFLDKCLTRDSKSITMGEFFSGNKQNDCLAVVQKLYPDIARALQDLGGFGEARLTGTGSCVFAEFARQDLAHQAYVALKKHWRVYLTKGLNKSPLQDKVQQMQAKSF